MPLKHNLRCLTWISNLIAFIDLIETVFMKLKYPIAYLQSSILFENRKTTELWLKQPNPRTIYEQEALNKDAA